MGTAKLKKYFTVNLGFDTRSQFNSDEWDTYMHKAYRAYQESSYKLAESYYLQALFYVNESLGSGRINKELIHMKMRVHQDLAVLFESQALYVQAYKHLKQAHEFAEGASRLPGISEGLRTTVVSTSSYAHFKKLEFYQRYRRLLKDCVL